ncbi:PREDICTED: DNA helicase MCM9-like [Nicrophorus vespilloides]|uniref:DNA helicase MCM9-like n=1 Tax=Nicrophorus vespilloides TaxID=110193 RepID=A0ABM1MC02_NICVS|nr:PREDICTED: DNA helicase MCM9-like [Nicrophorus vespilloides]
MTIVIAYLPNKHKEKLMKVLEDVDSTKHFGFALMFVEICDADPKLANSILGSPEEGLQACDNLIISAQEALITQTDNKIYTLKKNVHARVFGLPTCPEVHRTDLPKPTDFGSFLQLSGTI